MDGQDVGHLPFMLTVGQVQQLLRLSKPKAYGLLQIPGFPAVRFGKAIRVPKQAFLDWLEAQTGAQVG
jgi:excisionase family DNA binding protein